MVLLWLSDGFNPTRDLREVMKWRHSPAEATVAEVMPAINYGVIPDDNQDDSGALQALLDRRPQADHLEIELPMGEINLSAPLKVRQSQITVRGQGSDRTILTAQMKTGEAVLMVQPRSKAALQQVTIEGFTLRQTSPRPTVGILLNRVTHSSIRNVRFEPTRQPALMLRKTRDIALTYLAIDGDSKAAIMSVDAIKTTIARFSPIKSLAE